MVDIRSIMSSHTVRAIDAGSVVDAVGAIGVAAVPVVLLVTDLKCVSHGTVLIPKGCRKTYSVVITGVVPDFDTQSAGLDATVAPEEESAEDGLGEEVEDAVEDGLGVTVATCQCL